MKIAIIRNADHGGFGGAETFPVELMRLLEQDGYETFLISSHPKLLETAQDRGLKTMRGPWLKVRDWHGQRQLLLPFYILWQIYLFWWYIFMILRRQPDVLHPQNRDDFVAATLAGRLMGKRVIWTDHADLKFEFKNMNVWYKNWLGKIIYSMAFLAHEITVVSKSEQKLIKDSIGTALDDHLRVVYNGALEHDFTAVKKPKNTLVIGSTSRMVPIKGLIEVIEAFRKLDNKNVELWLVGDGPERKRLEKLAGKDQRIKFFGHQLNQYDYIASFDMFVLASHTEGFSLSLVEAAMFELAIVATNIGGNPELVKDGKTGLLVPAKNAQALHRAFQKLVDNPETRQKLAKNARQAYEKSFNFEVIVRKQFIPLYEGKI